MRVERTVSRMRLIDADTLEREGWFLSRNRQVDSKTMVYEVKKPTEFSFIEPERETGKWIPHKSVFGGLGEKVYTCDQCGYNIGFHAENFCPRCGADMRERREDETD